MRNDLKERPSAAVLRRRAFFVYECRIAPYESDPLGGFQIVSASERDYRDNCRKKRYEHRKVFVSFAYGAPRATAFEPNGKGIAISFHKWSCGRCRGKTIQAEKLRAQLQCSRSGRQVCQKAVMRKRAAEKTVALFRCPTHPVPPVRLKRRRFFVIVYRY